MTYYALTDIKSNFRFVYAKKGDELTLVTESIDVWIMAGKDGNRFACHKDKVSLKPPEADIEPQEIKPVDLFNQI